MVEQLVVGRQSRVARELAEVLLEIIDTRHGARACGVHRNGYATHGRETEIGQNGWWGGVREGFGHAPDCCLWVSAGR